MKKTSLIILGALLLSTGAMYAADLSLGFVNFKTCVEKSKQGQQEKVAFDALKKQMSESLEKTDKELTDLAKKIEDQEYMDGLSPTAEQELKGRFQGLSQEFSRYQNQYYQLLQQANYRMVQSLHDYVANAAEVVREKHKLSILLNEESAFATTTTMNYTDEVIKEMDKRYELDNGSKTAATAPEKKEVK